MRKRSLVLLSLYLAAAVAFVAYNGLRVVHIGAMVLPPVQAVVLSASLVLAASAVGLWLLVLSRWVLRRLVRPRPQGARGARLELGLALLLPLVGGSLYAYGRLVEPLQLVVRTLPLGVQGEGGAPPLRIAVLSDLHVDGEREPWLSLAAHVNATRPDVVLFLGDSLNRPAALPMLHALLAAIDAPHKLAVRGNWDVWYWHRLDLLGATGFTWLDGAVDLRLRGREVRLVGLPYGNEEDGQRGEQLLRAAAPGVWRLFAYHTPDLVEQVPAAELYLAGHTHGGQLALPGFGALITLSRYGKRFERGLARSGETLVYTNPGIGVEPILPLRVGVRPEITLVLLGDREAAAPVAVE